MEAAQPADDAKAAAKDAISKKQTDMATKMTTSIEASLKQMKAGYAVKKVQYAEDIVKEEALT